MRAVIDCRVSTKEQTLNMSLPTQMKACREYRRRHGYSIAREFVEEGESTKIADRTRLQELLTYCLQNKSHVQALVVYNVTRFAPIATTDPLKFQPEKHPIARGSSPDAYSGNSEWRARLSVTRDAVPADTTSPTRPQHRRRTPAGSLL